ncbi:MAG: HAD-IIA family hydrolase [Candidatus Limnocylindria bacterium]
MSPLPDRLRLVIFDLDGVIYRGAQAVDGARELVADLHREGVLVRFATNNSMVARDGYVDRLAEMGIPTAVDEIVTSTSATLAHLARHAPDVRSVLCIGADGMRDEFAAAGLEVTMARDAWVPDRPGGRLDRHHDAVVVGLDPEIEYRGLAAAMRAVEDGARLIATNADARYPTADGFLPGAGSLVAALATATGVAPEVIGKPSPAMFEAILEATGVSAGEAVVIGDNPDADIVGARRAGCASILVLTGVADAAMAATLTGERRPDEVAADPGAVLALLEGRLR